MVGVMKCLYWMRLCRFKFLYKLFCHLFTEKTWYYTVFCFSSTSIMHEGLDVNFICMESKYAWRKYFINCMLLILYLILFIYLRYLYLYFACYLFFTLYFVLRLYWKKFGLLDCIKRSITIWFSIHFPGLSYVCLSVCLSVCVRLWRYVF